MTVTDQLHAVLSSVAALEKSSADQASRVETLAKANATLNAENIALRQQLDARPPARPGTPVVTQWGFVANDIDPAAAVRLGLARMKADGGCWLRLWHSHFGAFSEGTTALIHAAADAGVSVIVCVQPKDAKPESLGRPDFADFARRNAPALKRLYAVEAGNELNLAQYRPDDLGGPSDWHRPYVVRWLRPLSAALVDIGVKTICTSITDTYHPENYAPQYDALLAAGARDCCAGVALHAYVLPQSLQMMANTLADLKMKWAMPIHVTECNVLTNNLTPAQWAERFAAYLAVLRSAGVASVQFYRGVPKPNGTWTWPTLFDSAGAPTPAYGTLLTAMKA